MSISSLLTGCGGAFAAANWSPGYQPAHSPGAANFAGSYQDTCSNCRFDRESRVLRCSCLDRNQIARHARLRNPGRCNFIKNNDGNLVCAGASGGHHGHRPSGSIRGSYQKTCHDCNMIGDTLSCNCTDADGMPNLTNLQNPHRCWRIENVNGNLVCHHR